jgi:DNA-binding NarL/FixJ family response regulator
LNSASVQIQASWHHLTASPNACGCTIEGLGYPGAGQGPLGNEDTRRRRSHIGRQAAHGVLKKLKRDTPVLDASNSAEAMDIVPRIPDIDLVLLDLTLSDRDGFSVLAELRKRLPQIAIVVLSAVQDRANVAKVLDVGALGFIPKSARSDVLNAVRLVLGDGI